MASSCVGSDATLLDHYLTDDRDGRGYAGAPSPRRPGHQLERHVVSARRSRPRQSSGPRDGIPAGERAQSIAVQSAGHAVGRGKPHRRSSRSKAYYQYEWKPLVLPPVGSYFSTIDIFGGGGLNAAFLGGGQYSDLGTNLDQAFALPAGTLGFDADFDRIPGRAVERPKRFRPVRHQPVRALARRTRHADRSALHALSQPLAAALRNHRRCRRGRRHVRRAGRRRSRARWSHPI